jgi:hypothetical protein
MYILCLLSTCSRHVQVQTQCALFNKKILFLHRNERRNKTVKYLHDLGEVLHRELQARSVQTCQLNSPNKRSIFIFLLFGGLDCVGHSVTDVAHLGF